ncbi:MAG: L-serine ammonia-lyase, iron-sulfur-dependent, subunit alpha [Selenomonas sp.]|uniref:L-serine ammonia-lyase, iron-sulfur-dependent, subunit alpha n=1 Tax=Selenomonas sp. TaxID=2053611 RepID=UPI0025FFC7FB|nr:L-serine ammonia-lyase, iron-sulfur-dependent, subunit alpha [Selenomonas sp.]MCR5757660.1 L-serine ammonia-lyase, iron-sulfur-dependent, subunit alpha [Selenomonas sp.]
MINFNTIQELIQQAQVEGTTLHEIVIQREIHDSQQSREEILQTMQANWQVMQAAIERGIANTEKSLSGLTGGDAKKLYAYRGNGYMGQEVLSAAAYAVGISEVNAVMGRIVACPTAGSCGIVPAALYAAKLQRNLTDERIVQGLFTAAGIGMVIDQNASIAGAEGGCQAECGTAAGMAAGALVELAGGSPVQIGNAVALAIKNLLGLVCDPVAGLVEVPCVKRNGFAVVEAMLAADMALSGIDSVIPVDEVIEAMNRIGKALPKSLRETSEGGLAVTATAKAIEKRIYK